MTLWEKDVRKYSGNVTQNKIKNKTCIWIRSLDTKEEDVERLEYEKIKSLGPLLGASRRYH
jgi:hypothetical protein